MNVSFHVDHHLQSQILHQLEQRGEQSFSELKPEGIENSLFMYHMRKLISRGIVEKSVSGFHFTPAGARWVNQTDMYQRAFSLPRPMVQLIVVLSDNVLVSERIDHMAEHLNRYMLPGGLHQFGQTSRESAERIAKKFSLTLTGKRIGQAEVIVTAKQHHSIVDYYEATAPNLDYYFDDELFQVHFMPVDEVISLSSEDAGALPEIIKSYIDNSSLENTFIL